MEFFEQTFDLVPVSVEQIDGFLSPISEYFRREIGRSVDVCLCEVENARREDNCHFNDLFGIIELDEDWNGEALNVDDRALLESQIRVSFTMVRVSALESFDSGLLIGLPDRTVIAVPEEPLQPPPTFLSVGGRNSH